MLVRIAANPEKSEFLTNFNAELVKLGWANENKASRWACAALPVRKPNSSEYRQTNDYRPVVLGIHD
ncbi:Glycoside hydrolase [Phytophthora megakarya]|uniref:Glycoside hydrolase n=1 Tax=Phytophthora megakarya TaxID=4795 RepID=A0A225UUV5_9STRA|nr:Glycoside hydrolase [Phytophthora megakarya]